ncbi:hypothetical protein EV191_103163 [Tamaricihabitans halophyticus]|uniref:YCII-related domain-containing protein n=1 Tax=Tamaricihabitans halophyticus TaxID=1262583 RepID=A0A4R2QVM4_9PSEU|nr:YciI family protein [Tamaricihabitans halophyticus]TCP54122.1 hypothetical protein EV191_103163 [Tamaricihabitans halophyticus]
MAWYLVEIRYVPEKLAEVRPKHRAYLAELAEQGVVAMAGPLADDTGGILLIQAEQEQELYERLNADPYYTEGVIAERTVRGYRPLLGSWVPAS